MIQQLDPARAIARDPTSLWDHPLWKLERKLNGWRFLMHFGRDLDRTYLTGRRISDRTGVYSEKGLLVPQLWVTRFSPSAAAALAIAAQSWLHSQPQVSSLQDEFRPDCSYTVLDGEILPPPGCGLRDVASFMNTDYHQAQATIAKWGPPTYCVFDVLYCDGQDVREQPMLERRRLMTRALTYVRNPLIRAVEQYSPRKSYFDTEIADGGEGVVLKRIDAIYGERGGWIKVKRAHTLDVVVTGFTEGKGKYAGQIGAVKVSVYSSTGELLEVAQVSGMDDTIRLDMSRHRASWIGEVVEIEAQEWGRDRLMHPRFVRSRPESSARSCTFAKMMADLDQSADEEKRMIAQTAREQLELLK